MKTRLFPLLLIIVPLGAWSQIKSSNFASAAEVSGGWAEDGFGAVAAFNYHFDRWTRGQLGFMVGIGNESPLDYTVPYRIATFQVGYFRRVLVKPHSRQPFSLYLGGGALIGYEAINKGRNELSNGAELRARSRMIYGGYIGLEAERVVIPDLSIILKLHEHYHHGSDLGSLYPYVGIGVCYYLF